MPSSLQLIQQNDGFIQLQHSVIQRVQACNHSVEPSLIRIVGDHKVEQGFVGSHLVNTSEWVETRERERIDLAKCVQRETFALSYTYTETSDIHTHNTQTHIHTYTTHHSLVPHFHVIDALIQMVQDGRLHTRQVEEPVVEVAGWIEIPAFGQLHIIHPLVTANKKDR